MDIDVIIGSDVNNTRIQRIKSRHGDGLSLLRLSYLYCGHYDAVLDKHVVDNPEYDHWCYERDKQVSVDQWLASCITQREDDQSSHVSATTVIYIKCQIYKQYICHY